MRPLCTAAVFLSAFLLFTAQPLAAKWLLPSLGGSPAVWIACMLFFQATLLCGYGYAHVLSRTLAPGGQALVHAALLLAALAFLPLTIPSAAGEGDPALSLLSALSRSLGLPALLLSATSPLLQAWYAASGGAQSRDPYPLYAASNSGSLLALLAYPILVERFLPVVRPGGTLLAPGAGAPGQNLVWSWGYVLFACLCVACGAVLPRAAGTKEGSRQGRPRRPADAAKSVVGRAGGKARPALSRARERALWLALSAVPSSLLLGTTLVITTDIVAVPMLWVAPLAVYLLTFIVSFARPGALPPALSCGLLAVCLLATAAARWIVHRPDPILMVTLSLLTLLAAAYACHDRLALLRPPPERLTSFYLWLAAGGAIGGVFNALVAPRLFDSVVEYPAALVLAALLAGGVAASQASRNARRDLALDVLLPVGLAVLLAGLLAIAEGAGWAEETRRAAAAALGCGLGLAFVRRRARFALALAVVLAGAWFDAWRVADTLHSERTFFGVLRVEEREGKPFKVTTEAGTIDLQHVDSRDLFHGTTRHGLQLLDPEMRRLASSYFHPTGPAGRLLRSLRGTGRLSDVAVIGLGVGALAAYGMPGQRWTFYEIDPAVVRIARDPSLFTYLRDTPAEVEVRVGDGRLLVGSEPAGRFHLVVVDGFTSDAVPVHLLTREALEVYFHKLAPGGLLVLHLSNEHFDLVRVVRALAADLGLAGLVWDDRTLSPRLSVERKAPSVWAVLARRAADLDAVRPSGAWVALAEVSPRPLRDEPLWTDTFSSPLAVLK